MKMLRGFGNLIRYGKLTIMQDLGLYLLERIFGDLLEYCYFSASRRWAMVFVCAFGILVYCFKRAGC